MKTRWASDQDEIWKQAAEIAEREVAKAQKQIAARCRELGIPERFAPGLKLSWSHRGYANMLETRRKQISEIIFAIQPRADFRPREL